MEGWTQVELALFDVFSCFSVLFFVPIVVVGAWFLLNLTLAVLKAKFTEKDLFSDNNNSMQKKEEYITEEQARKDDEKESSSSSEDEDYIPPADILRDYKSGLRGRVNNTIPIILVMPTDRLESKLNLDIE